MVAKRPVYLDYFDVADIFGAENGICRLGSFTVRRNGHP